MKYKENRIYTTTQGVEVLTALLLSYGIDNVTVDDPGDIKELVRNKDKGEWDFIEPSLIDGNQEVTVTFYSEENESGEQTLEDIRIDIMKLKSDELYGKYGGDADFGRLYVESAALSDDWKDEWKKGIHPFNITKNIVIKPSWEDYEKKNHEEVIEIDPGMAFGTGTHETTGACAKFLAKTVKEGDCVLDIGTGTGLLAIIAVLCGAKHVDAWDIDETAVEVAKRNVSNNGCKSQIDVMNSDILKNDIINKYEVIVANLTSSIIKKMLPKVKNMIAPEGRLILSGMLADEKETTYKFFVGAGMNIVEEVDGDDWYSLIVEVKGSNK